MNSESNIVKMHDILDEIYEALSKEAMRDSSEKIFKVGFLKNFLQDLDYVDILLMDTDNIRYVSLILRNTLEHTIIFKALQQMHNEKPNIYKDYFGLYTNLDDLEQLDEASVLKKFGGNRTIYYKNNFRQLAEKFEEPDADTSLYKLYKLLSDYCHNSYYHDIMDFIEKPISNIDIKNIIDVPDIEIIKTYLLQTVLEEFI